MTKTRRKPSKKRYDKSMTASLTLPASLPDPLRFLNGEPVTMPPAWQKRRAEILHLFQIHVYGRNPVERPAGQRFHAEALLPNALGGAALAQQVQMIWPGSPKTKTATFTATFTLFLPAHVSRPCPTWVFICNREKSHIDLTRPAPSPFFPIEAIVARGYAAAAFQVDEIDPDTPDAEAGYRRGVRHFFAPTNRRETEAWGSIAAWAWGASRVMDYLGSVPEVDTKRVGVVGHSRGGKAALWCGAQDTRFALTVSNNSGQTGAALSRGKTGERIADINERFPHWFCANYHDFNHRENDLPVDQHELLCLLAPRLVYVASATGDLWADPRSEFLSCIAAGPVFRLLGKKGVEASALPAPETLLHTGNIGYHLRTGKHDLTPYDWQCFMDFADAKWGKP